MTRMTDPTTRYEIVIRTETWEREGRRVMVDVQHDETVIVAVQILHEMLRDLGWKQVNQ